jgi:cell division protein FtsA
MEQENYIVALEVGSSKICAAAAKTYPGGSIEVVDFVEKDIKPQDEILRNGQIDTVTKTSEIVNELLESISNNLAINLEDINVNISSPYIQSKAHSMSSVKKSAGVDVVQADVDALVADSLASFKISGDKIRLHMQPQDLYVNGVMATDNVLGKVGSELKGDFMFLTCPKESIENFYYTFSNVSAKIDAKNQEETKGISIDYLLLSSVADGLSLLNHKIDDKRNGVALVNIGAELTDLAVYFKNSLRLFKCIPMSGNAITQDIADAFSLSFDEAEKVKIVCSRIPVDAESSSDVLIVERTNGLENVQVPVQQALSIIEWRIKEIAALVRVELHRADFLDKIRNGMIVSGGSANYAGLINIFKDISTIKNIRSAIYTDKIGFGNFENLRLPEYSTLLGLLLANNNPTDTRVDNSVLKHSEINIQKPKASPSPSQNPQQKVKDKKGGLGSFFKNMLGGENMDDDKNY